MATITPLIGGHGTHKGLPDDFYPTWPQVMGDFPQPWDPGAAVPGLREAGTEWLSLWAV